MHHSKAKNILLCSATLGNIHKLEEYVNRVSERDFLTYQNDSRLTSLFFEGDISPETIKDALIVTFSKNNIQSILNELEDLRNKQTEDKLNKIEQLAEEDGIENEDILFDARRGLAGYYGALLPKEKLFIEKCFEQGLIDTVVGTDALALGVNFPVEKVVFAQLAKYYDGPISKNLFEQLAGRAGRKGYFDNGYVYYCSDFSNYLEAWEYDTEELFDELLEAKNEDISITLTPNIKNILQGNTTVDAEAKFIADFSTEPIDIIDTFYKISNIVEYVEHNAFEKEVERKIDEEYEQYEEEEYDEYDDYEYDEEEYERDNEDEYLEEIEMRREELSSKRKEFYQNIARVYFDEYSPEENCRVFADILFGTSPDEILEKYASTDDFYGMLQFRKYVKALPKQYRKGLTKINDKIRSIDETAIDGFRGEVSVEEIGKGLEKEHKLEKENVMEVLNRYAESKETLGEKNVIAEELGEADDRREQ